MPTTTDCPPDQPRISPEPTVTDLGFLRLLARAAVEQARVEGPITAVRDLVRAETFLRSFRRHLLQVPREARGESYNVGLIMIELMIMRESLRSPGRAPAI